MIFYSNLEVAVALGFAALVNIATVIMAAGAFHNGRRDVVGIETAYRTLLPVLGPSAAGVFLLALMASGISESLWSICCRSRPRSRRWQAVPHEQHTGLKPSVSLPSSLIAKRP
ncbi:divalent metal cation transporter [Roseomonas chloroacetimidivorans]|uniref:divalent metal cation transporter n=1 Tax=Roseomonas chloroacetimidivorans TaxID=1766656 RepID=UPI003C759FD9